VSRVSARVLCCIGNLVKTVTSVRFSDVLSRLVVRLSKSQSLRQDVPTKNGKSKR